jgi:hypothetical protein
VSDAIKTETPAHAFLDRLLDEEITFRDERRIRTSPRLSGLPTGLTLASFDFAIQPSIEGSHIEALATCAWLRTAASSTSKAAATGSKNSRRPSPSDHEPQHHNRHPRTPIGSALMPVDYTSS